MRQGKVGVWLSCPRVLWHADCSRQGMDPQTLRLVDDALSLYVFFFLLVYIYSSLEKKKQSKKDIFTEQVHWEEGFQMVRCTINKPYSDFFFPSMIKLSQNNSEGTLSCLLISASHWNARHICQGKSRNAALYIFTHTVPSQLWNTGTNILFFLWGNVGLHEVLC